jgi:hypothetical protein
LEGVGERWHCDVKPGEFVIDGWRNANGIKQVFE